MAQQPTPAPVMDRRTDPETVRILREAREMLTPEGSWCQGTAGDGPPYCLLNALQDTPGAINEEAYLRAYRAIARATSSCSGLLVDWNDAPGRTHAEVLAVLDRAIAHAEGL